MEIDRTKADPVSMGTRWTDGFRLFKSTATHSRSPKVALRSLQLRLVEDTRLAGVLRGSISALAGRGFAVLVNAAIMPLALRYLGKLEFGVWVTISTSVVMLSVLDLGIANTLTNFIAAAHAEDDRQRALRFYSTAFWVTSAVTLVSSSFCVLAWRAIPWAIVFNLSSPLQLQHASLCVAIAAGFFLLSLPLTLMNKVLAGYQQVHIANYFAMINSLLSLAAILGTIVLHGTIVSLMAAYCVALLLGTLALNVWVFVWQRPWLLPHPRFVDHETIRTLFGQGFLFFIIQFTGLVVFGSDNLVITHYLGPAEVTPYSFAWRLTSYSAMVQVIMLPSLWPAFAEAFHKGDLGWIRETYNSVTNRSLVVVGSTALLFGLTGRALISVWGGAAAVPAHSIVWTMAAFNVVMAATTNQAFLLNAAGRLRIEATVAVLAAASNLTLSIYLVQRIGAEGVILATLLSFLVFMIVPQHMEVKNVLAGRGSNSGARSTAHRG